VEIASGSLIDYPGNYSEFIEKRRLSSSGSEERELSPAFKEDGVKERKRAEAEKRNLLYRKKRKVLERLEPIERGIEELEKEQSERDALLADPVFLADSGKVTQILIERSETEQKLETLLSDWEKLMAEIEEIEKTG
jgi:ATP-binding cassette subfamily F protein 3